MIGDAGELAQNINQKNKLDVLQSFDVHSMTIMVGESISSISMQNIVNHLGKHFLGTWFFLWVGSKQIERKENFFPIKLKETFLL